MHHDNQSHKLPINSDPDNGDENEEDGDHTKPSATRLGTGFKNDKDQPNAFLLTEQEINMARDQALARV